jgi:hypothetical protein
MHAIQALSNATSPTLGSRGKADDVLFGLGLVEEANPYMAVIGVVGTLFNITESVIIMHELK